MAEKKSPETIARSTLSFDLYKDKMGRKIVCGSWKGKVTLCLVQSSLPGSLLENQLSLPPLSFSKSEKLSLVDPESRNLSSL